MTYEVTSNINKNMSVLNSYYNVPSNVEWGFLHVEV